MPVSKKHNKDSLIEELALKGIEYFNKKASIKELESQCREYRIPLEKHIDSEGRTLESGSKLSVLPYADVDVHLKKTLRVGKKLLPSAVEALRSNGLHECLVETISVNEDKVEELYKEGIITDSLLKEIYSYNPTYAFSVEIKNRMGDAPD